jgi:hypothetical protein
MSENEPHLEIPELQSWKTECVASEPRKHEGCCDFHLAACACTALRCPLVRTSQALPLVRSQLSASEGPR